MTYLRYKKIMNLIGLNYHGVELSHVAAPYVWGIANEDKVFGWKHFAKAFFSLNVSNVMIPEGGAFMSTFMDGYRKDHLDLFNGVVSGLSEKPSLTYLYEAGMKISFHPFLIVKSLWNIIKKYRRLNIGLYNVLHLVAEYSYLMNTIEELDNRDFSHVKKYLCMSHVFSMENLFTQYLKGKGVETFSLEEGLYIVHKKKKVLGSIAYELFVTDHLLCWGKYTKDEYTEYGISPDRIIVAGYPKCKALLPSKPMNTYKKCLVLLAGPIFGDVNDKLLEMLASLKEDLSVTLKPHPANYKEMEAYAITHDFNIVQKQDSLVSCFKSGIYDFCIAVNTTAYYESWMYGLPCIRYNDDRFDTYYGFDDLFSTQEELMSIVSSYRKNPKSEEDVKEMLEYAVGYGIDNYDRAINGNV